MTKLSLAAVALLSMMVSAQAKDVRINEFGDVAVRGAPCAFFARVDGKWQATGSRCSMLRSAISNNTLVWIGAGRMLIVRDPDEPGFAKLYRVIPGTDELGFMGNAIASGNWWIARGARFYAK